MRTIMNCAQTRQYLYDYIDGNLELFQKQVLEQHVSACDQCKLLVKQESKFKDQLKGMPVVGPSMGFEQRVMAKLASEKSARQVEKRGFMSQTWFAPAMGGAFMTFVLMWFVSFETLVTTTAPTTLSAVTVELIPNQIQKVNLAFNSPSRIDKAIFKIILPPNVEMSGHKGKRELQWASSLKQGANHLALPLVATELLTNEKIEQFITARISHEGKSRDFKIKVISKAQQSGIQMEVIPIVDVS